MSHGLNQATTNPDSFGDDNLDRHELSELDQQVTKYAEVVRSRELHTFKLVHQVMKPFGLANTTWSTKVELPPAKVHQQWMTTCNVKSSNT